jgi:hypothetical protein
MPIRKGITLNFKIKTLLAGVAAFGLVASGLSLPANATGVPTISLVDNNDSLAGSTISGYDPAVTLRVALLSTLGTISWADGGSGSQLVSGGGSTAQGIWLEGTQSQLNAALTEMTINRPCTQGNYTLYGQVTDSGVVENPLTGHLYKEVPNNNTFDADKLEAESTPLVAGGTDTFGYLATVTDSFENLIVSKLVSNGGWIGASDAAVEGDWAWVGGPEAGTVFYRGQGDTGGAPVDNAFSNWNDGEPNNFQGSENYAEVMSDGHWNDNSGTREYTIEWGGMQGDNLAQVQIAAASIAITNGAPFTGAGTQADPYLIGDVGALRAVGFCGSLDSYYKQTADITLPSTWSGAQSFQGHYDGDNKKISFSPNTKILHNRFGVWGRAGDHNSSFVNMDVYGDLDANGNGQIGLLFGRGNASVNDSKFDGSINSTLYQTQFGSVAGSSGSSITGVTSTVNFTSSDAGTETGGIVGYFYGDMEHSSWSGTMNLTGDIGSVGGLVGDTDCATLGHSKASGSITVSGNADSIGGVAGWFCGDASDLLADVTVVASNSGAVGGVAGVADGNFYRVAAFGDVTGGVNVGGLLGEATWNVAENTYSTGNVAGTSAVGSIAGSVQGFTFTNAYSTGSVSDASNSSQGPFGAIYSGTFTAVNWDPTQIGFGIPLGSLQSGQTPYGSADQTNLAYYQAENWDISSSWSDSKVWTICPAFGNGTPFLTGLYSSNPCERPLTNATAPTITGTGIVGKALGVNSGNWDSGVTFTYQWKLDANNISGATAATYIPTDGDVGKAVTVEITGTKQGFTPAAKLSSNSVVVSKAPKASSIEISIGEFGGNAWWIPMGFVANVKAAVKAHNKATSVTCTGIVAPGGNKAWQQKLGLKRATLACAVVKSFNSKLKTKLAWRVAAAGDKIQRGSALKFNK